MIKKSIKDIFESYLKKSSTEKEIAFLYSWIKDKSNKTELNELIDEFSQKDDTMNLDHLLGEDEIIWRQIQTKLNERSTLEEQYSNISDEGGKHIKRKIEELENKKVIFWKRFRAVAATISLILVGFLILDSSLKFEQPKISELNIQPGISKATLFLENGKSFELTEKTDLTIETGDTKIVGAGSSISYSLAPKEKTASSKELQFNTLQIPRGGEFFLELSDGTKVWINSDSRLIYPVQFIGNERNVELIGEAYFEVAPNVSKPFIVTSGVQSIEVLGTSFNLTSYEDDNEIITTLVEGKVTIWRSHGDQGKIVLLPNQQSIMTKRDGEILTRNVDVREAIAWKSGKFYFHNESMSNIMKILSRWYDINVFFDNSRISRLLFSGGFKRYENFEQVKSIIESTEELTFSIKENTVIIK